MGGLGNTDSQTGLHLRRFHPPSEPDVTAAAQIDAVFCAGDSERLGQLAWTGAKLAKRLASPALPHQFDAVDRLQRPNQHKTVLHSTPDEHIEEPIHAVIEIDIRCTRRVAAHKLPRAGPEKRMASLIALGAIGLGLHNDPRTLSGSQFASDQLP